jgi:hypothetical protein
MDYLHDEDYRLDFDALFDFLEPGNLDLHWLRIPIESVYTAALVLLGLSLTMFVLALVFQYSYYRYRPQAKSRYAHWKPILQGAIRADATHLTDAEKLLIRQHPQEFVLQWIEVAESVATVSEVEGYQLSTLLKKSGLLPKLEQWLSQGHAQRRMLAIRVFGLLLPPDPSIWYKVFYRLQDKDPFLALNAANTLFHINPVKALPAILDAYCARSDWPSTKVSHILFFSHPVEQTQAVLDGLENRLEALSQLTESHTRKLLQLLRFHNSVSINQFLIRQLHRYASKRLAYNLPEAHDPILAILDTLTTMEQLDDVSFAIPYASHPDWRYRLKAVRLLGEHSNLEDYIPHLEKSINDPEWWVAFRAAEALQRHQRLAQDKNTLSRQLQLAP